MESQKHPKKARSSSGGQQDQPVSEAEQARRDAESAARKQTIALAAHEANLPKDSWRGGHEYFRSVGDGRTRYLQFLAEAYGYQHADIEK